MPCRVRGIPSNITSGDVLNRLRRAAPFRFNDSSDKDIYMVKCCSLEDFQDAIFPRMGLPWDLVQNPYLGITPYSRRVPVAGLDFDGFHGLTQLYNTQGQIDADVVAVTDLNDGSNAYGAWSCEMEDQEIMWLRDFLKKDLPNCRTMLFGYTMDPNDVSYSVSNYVNLLLQELNKVRMQPAERQRPLVLMGHGIGCMAIVAALVKAGKHERKFPSIFENVRGIILFGPPYSSPHLYSLLPRPSKLSNSEPKVTRWLGLQASIVNQYAEDFALVSSDIRIVAFHEAMLARASTEKSGSTVSQPVPFGFLPTTIEAVHIVETEHSEMISFEDTQNDIYKIVIGHLNSYINDVPTTSITARILPNDPQWWKYVAEFNQETVTTREGQRGRRETWQIEKVIGEGGFGQVYRHKRLFASGVSTRLQTNPTVRAVKSVPQTMHRNDTNTIERELCLMIAVRQYTSNFVEFYGWYEDKAKTIYIVMEYIAGGDLHTYMRQDRVRAKRDSRIISFQILTALEILHEHQICHRDLKPQNVLISSLSPLNVKLADFGISKSIGGNTKSMTTRIGTPNYIAPEVQGLSGYRRGPTYTQAVDIWALGVLTHELYTGTLPFTDNGYDDEETSGIVYDSVDNLPTNEVSPTQIVEYCKKKDGSAFPDTTLREAGASDSLLSFILSVLCPDPQKRLSASGALEHVWITVTDGPPESEQNP